MRPEQEEAEQQYCRVSPRFVQLGNDFLKNLSEGGIPELARLPHTRSTPKPVTALGM